MAKISPMQRRAGQLIRNHWFQNLVLARGRVPKLVGNVQRQARVGALASYSIFVSDLAASQAFYTRVAGLEPGEIHGPEPHPLLTGRTITYRAMHGNGQHNSLILIEQRDSAGNVIPVGDRGLMHLALILNEGQSPYLMAKQLRRLHVPISYGPIKHYEGPGGDGGSGGNIAVYVHDPDGHMVELYCCMDPPPHA